jgi:hypothetical protein
VLSSEEVRYDHRLNSEVRCGTGSCPLKHFYRAGERAAPGMCCLICWPMPAPPVPLVVLWVIWCSAVPGTQAKVRFESSQEDRLGSAGQPCSRVVDDVDNTRMIIEMSIGLWASSMWRPCLAFESTIPAKYPATKQLPFVSIRLEAYHPLPHRGITIQ